MAVTENGAAFEDVPGPDGEVDDPRRTAYLRAHISAVRDALAAGVDVRAYFVWSLLDNFEWSYGYSKRFGIVRVDFGTGKRVVKASGHWYRRIVEANGSGL
jgi:beta-glucosidase